jgi:hypothetical protein
LGKDEQSPEVQKLIADANAGLFSKVVVFNLDSLSATEASLGSRYILHQLLRMVGEWESDAIADRIKSGRLTYPIFTCLIFVKARSVFGRNVRLVSLFSVSCSGNDVGCNS